MWKLDGMRMGEWMKKPNEMNRFIFRDVCRTARRTMVRMDGERPSGVR